MSLRLQQGCRKPESELQAGAPEPTLQSICQTGSGSGHDLVRPR